MKKKAIVALALMSIDLLLIDGGSKRQNHKGLRLSPREHSRAVSPRQNTDLTRDRSNLIRAPAVRANSLVEDHPPDIFLLEILER